MAENREDVACWLIMARRDFFKRPFQLDVKWMF